MPVVTEVSRGGGVTYYINADAGVVVAKIDGNKWEAFDIIESLFNIAFRGDRTNMPVDYIGKNYNKANAMKDKYVGRAKCHDGDIFDVEVGKRIALAKAQRKYHSDLAKLLGKFGASLQGVVTQIANRSDMEFLMSNNTDTFDI